MTGAVLLLAVSAAGGAGAVARHEVDRRVGTALRRRSALRGRPAPRAPWGTLVVNVTGSLLLGLLTGLAAGAPGSLLAVAGSGFCGGYTTFSTAVVQVVRAAGDGDARTGAAYAAGTLLATVAAAGAGLVAGAALRGG